jgi:mannose-6-phosphate isomerase-like protein (cupin superfamily)
MPLKFNRVVTATSAEGHSYILHNSPPETVVEQPGRALTFFELWETDGPLASNEGNEDAGARPIRHHPPYGGTRFRMVELMPDEKKQSDAVSSDFDNLNAFNIRIEDADDPTMHRNETVDYNIILSGEVVAVTEMDEALLRAGDVIIQRGTAHTWHNRSNEPCVFASIMVSAAPIKIFGKSEGTG